MESLKSLLKLPEDKQRDHTACRRRAEQMLRSLNKYIQGTSVSFTT